MKKAFEYVQSRIPLNQLSEDEQKDVFFKAVYTGNTEILRQCIQNGIDVNMINEDGNAALHILASKSDFGSTKILIDVPGINKNIRTAHSYTPLHIACVTALDISYIEFLLNNGFDPNMPDRLGKRPIQFSIESDAIQAVKLLLEFNAEINYSDAVDNSPLSIALLDRMNFDISNLLLKHNANPQLDRGNGTPLFLDCILACNSTRMFKNFLLLFKYKINPHVVHPLTKRNALHYASISGYMPVIKELLKHKVDVHAKDIASKTPVDIAKDHCHYEVLALYMEYMTESEICDLFADVDYDIIKRFMAMKKGKYDCYDD